jgi:parallel beta-helix repeat protein
MKKGIVHGIIFLFVMISFTSIPGIQIDNNIVVTSGRGNILYVGGSGPGNYSSIQEAIIDANNSDTIYVFSGTYNENIKINKQLDLISQDKNTTILKKSIEITADNVMVKGFTISGIRIYSDNNKIYDNIILYSLTFGIYIFESSNNHIHKNIIGDRAIGILIDNSEDNLIDNNTIINCSQSGIALGETSWTTISDNSISNHKGKYYDATGITLVDSHKNVIVGNTISNNDKGISSFYGTGHTKIYHNNFINNKIDGNIEIGEDNWDEDYPIGGNYWNGYTGSDNFCGEYQNLSGSDGIGDVLYQTDDEDIVDNYPFMEPNGWDLNFPPFVNSLVGPKAGKPGCHSFTAGAFDPDMDLWYVKFDWGDGSYSGWIGPNENKDLIDVEHSYFSGIYYVKGKTKDEFGAESNWSEPKEIHIEDVAPQLRITKPEKAFYINDRKLLPRFFGIPLIFGFINVTVDAVDVSGIEKVEFYIDDVLKSVDSCSPFSYIWGRDGFRFIHLHVIKVVAFDKAGNTATTSMIVRKFF